MNNTIELAQGHSWPETNESFLKFFDVKHGLCNLPSGCKNPLAKGYFNLTSAEFERDIKSLRGDNLDALEVIAEQALCRGRHRKDDTLRSDLVQAWKKRILEDLSPQGLRNDRNVTSVSNTIHVNGSEPLAIAATHVIETPTSKHTFSFAVTSTKKAFDKNEMNPTHINPIDRFDMGALGAAIEGIDNPHPSRDMIGSWVDETASSRRRYGDLASSPGSRYVTAPMEARPVTPRNKGYAARPKLTPLQIRDPMDERSSSAGSRIYRKSNAELVNQEPTGSDSFWSVASSRIWSVASGSFWSAASQTSGQDSPITPTSLSFEDEEGKIPGAYPSLDSPPFSQVRPVLPSHGDSGDSPLNSPTHRLAYKLDVENSKELKKYIEKGLSPTQLPGANKGRRNGNGDVYSFGTPENFAPNLTPMKIGYARCSDCRMMAIEKNCDYDPQMVKAYRTDIYKKLETIIHKHLAKDRLVERQCRGCGGKHREFFDVTPEKADFVIKAWAEWSHLQPYDAGGVLKQEWRDKLKTMDMHSPTCWAKFLGVDKDEYRRIF